MSSKKLTVPLPFALALELPARVARPPPSCSRKSSGRSSLWPSVSSCRSTDHRQLNGILRAEECSGAPMARMQYSQARHASLVVVQHGCKIVGWPTGLLFTNFGDLPGGLATRRELLTLWNTGAIRVEPATPEDIANAIRDPRTVHPGYDPDAPRTEVPPSDAFVVAPLVLHSQGDLGFISLDPTFALGDRTRQQRSDTKRPHKRDLTSRYNRSRMLPRAGIKSDPYVFDSAANRSFVEARRTPDVRAGGEELEHAPSRTHRAGREPVTSYQPITTWAYVLGAAASRYSSVFAGGSAMVAASGEEERDDSDPIMDA